MPVGGLGETLTAGMGKGKRDQGSSSREKKSSLQSRSAAPGAGISLGSWASDLRPSEGQLWVLRFEHRHQPPNLPKRLAERMMKPPVDSPWSEGQSLPGEPATREGTR